MADNWQVSGAAAPHEHERNPGRSETYRPQGLRPRFLIEPTRKERGRIDGIAVSTDLDCCKVTRLREGSDNTARSRLRIRDREWTWTGGYRDEGAARN